MAERLQKVLARAGFGSRRAIEEQARQGRITVNGETARPGTPIKPGDRVCMDGRPLALTRAWQEQPSRVLLYHKPEGEMCTSDDPEGRPTVFDRLPPIQAGRWVSVGRLDFNTSGVLLFTTDGKLANRLMHPSGGVEREYAVRVLGEVSADVIDKLTRGVELDDGLACFDDVRDAGGRGANHWYHVTLSEGRNREVRRLWESQGVTVSRLIRVRFGPIKLPGGLKPGRWKELTDREIRQLGNRDSTPPIRKKPRRRPRG